MKPFQVLLYRNCLYSFPFQSNTNRLSDLTAHRLVKGERSSTLIGGLSFDMRLKNNRQKGSFSPLFACQSLTPVTGENCSLFNQVSWEDLPHYGKLSTDKIPKEPSSLDITSCWSPTVGFPNLWPHVQASAVCTHIQKQISRPNYSSALQGHGCRHTELTNLVFSFWNTPRLLPKWLFLLPADENNWAK